MSAARMAASRRLNGGSSSMTDPLRSHRPADRSVAYRPANRRCMPSGPFRGSVSATRSVGSAGLEVPDGRAAPLHPSGGRALGRWAKARSSDRCWPACSSHMAWRAPTSPCFACRSGSPSSGRRPPRSKRGWVPRYRSGARRDSEAPWLVRVGQAPIWDEDTRKHTGIYRSLPKLPGSVDTMGPGDRKYVRTKHCYASTDRITAAEPALPRPGSAYPTTATGLVVLPAERPQVGTR